MRRYFPDFATFGDMAREADIVPAYRRLPDLLFGLYGELVIFDHVDKTIKVVANADLTSQPNADAAYRDACRRIDDLVTRLQQPPLLSLGEIDTESAVDLKVESNFSRD